MSRAPRAGEVLCSPLSEARFLVIASGTVAGMPLLDGRPLVAGTGRPCSSAPHSDGDIEFLGGRRYVDQESGLVLQCIWPGPGSLVFEGRRLTLEHQTRKRLTLEQRRKRLRPALSGAG